MQGGRLQYVRWQVAKFIPCLNKFILDINKFLSDLNSFIFDLNRKYQFIEIDNTNVVFISFELD